ncbi:MAG: hypothetical protein K6T65_08430 [Peptococcaceae bacterium]|nr:hypothetical protein [Peptococcaceae bacterium]
MPSNYKPLYPQESLDAMYPDIYWSVYPTIKQMCEMYDTPGNPGFYPYPTRAAVEHMADYICQCITREKGMERQEERGLLRALVLILLIRELLRRRGSY